MTCAPAIALPRAVGTRTGGALPIFLCACVALALTGFTAPGRSGASDVGGIDAIALVKIALRGTSFLFLLLLALALNFHHRTTAVLRRLLPMVMFALWTVATAIWSPLRAMSIGHSLEIVMLTTVAVCAAIVMDSERVIGRLCFLLFTVMAGACLFVLIADAPSIRAGERPAGYMHPNSLGAVAGIALTVLIASRVLWGWRWSRRLLIPGILVCGAAIFAARSRTDLLVTLFVLALFLLVYSRRALALVLLLACGGLFAFMPYVSALGHVGQSVTAYFLRGQTREDLITGSGRDEVWHVALNSAREAPWFGHGYYTMSDSGKVFVWGKEQVQTAHDVYLHVLTGSGAIGLALFLWALGSMILPMVRPALRERNRVAILALGVIVWQLTGSLFEVGIVGPVDAVTVAFFALGGAAVGNTLHPRDIQEAPPCVS